MRATFNRWFSSPWAKPFWFLLSCLPAAWLVFAALTDQLGANPAEALVMVSGICLSS